MTSLSGRLSRSLPRICLALLLLLPLSAHALDPVFISEFMASNTSGLKDEDGAYSDWIEIFNSASTNVNLNGWFLTDAAGNLTKWRFPNTNLPPSGFLIVFASSKNRATPGLPLHANFSLSAGGEYLALVRPDGVTIASEFSPQFPDQFADVSYGIGQDYLVTRLVSAPATGRVYVPTSGVLGNAWTANAFNDSGWRAATNGVGFETYVPGFAVRNIRANITVCDLATAETVLSDPSRQGSVFVANPATVNYVNTGDDAHFAGGLTFPGFTMNVDENNFVTEATGMITIPVSTNWTFGVNSDDGFRLTIGGNVLEYPAPRGPADSFATFFLPAGEYPVRLVFYECGGGSEVELFAARGTHTGWSTAFSLVGSAGGLSVKCQAGSAAGASSLRPLIATDVEPEMSGKASSAYLRLPFTLSDPASFSSLTLRMKYNDAFVAYLNGTEVARRNFSGAPQWNSVASAPRPAQNALVAEDIDVSSFLGLLQSGNNVLALQGMNESITGSQFVIQAELLENKLLGATNNHYFALPTPGAFNSLDYIAFVQDLKFTPNRGTYLNTNISVTITSATPSVTIRYTRDGSAPSPANGLIYTGPIAVSDTTILRAIGYRAGFRPTDVETHSYIFLNKVQLQSTNNNYVGGSSGNYTLNTGVTQTPPYRDTFTNDLLSLPTVSIAVAWEDFFGPAGIWSNPTGQGVGWERPCSAEYFFPSGKKGFSVNCGLRIQGGVSRTAVEKHSLRLLFKGIYGPSKLRYAMFPDSAVTQFDTLSLHAGFNDQWLWLGAGATMQRDFFCRETQNAMGGYAAHGTYAHLYVNGLYWGLYNIGEKSDDSFAASYLGGEKEEYDALTADEFIAGNMDAWNTMLSIVDAGITTDAAYTNISRYLDIPKFIDYMLMNFYVANVDWPGHNWTAARRRVPGAGFHFFSWDAEWVLGVGSDPTTDRTGIGAGDGTPGRIYAALRAHPEFRRQFGDRAQKHCFNGGALTPQATQTRWSTRMAEIDRAMVGEAARWGKGFTRETWLAAESQVQVWFPQRTATLVNQLRNAGLFPQISAPEFRPLGGIIPQGSSVTLTNPSPAGVIYYTTDGSDPRLWGGAIAPSAKLYSSPLSFTNATFVRARVYTGGQWSALIENTFYIVQDFSRLAITEIMYNPPMFGTVNGEQVEFIELKNTGTTSIDLSGLQFTDGITFAFTNSQRVNPGAFVVLVRDPVAFAAKYPSVAYQGVYTGKLDNGGERLTLAHVLGTNVFSFSFNTRAPWPVTPDGFGFSLVRTSLTGDPDAAASWRASTNPGGSPGADDPAPTIPPVVINEVLTHTDLPQLDTIELANLGASPAAIGGWYLTDDPAYPKKFLIPAGLSIPAGGYVTFDENQFNAIPGSPASFRLSSWGEPLYLFSGDGSGNLSGYSHGLSYGPAANGVSFGRFVISTGEELWPAQTTLTLGGINSGPKIGPIVINEILYNAAPGYDEFVELYNVSGSAVPLFDPAFPTNTWKLSGLGYAFPANITVPAGGYVVLSPIDPAAYRSKYNIPAEVQVFGPYTGNLQGNGESLRLVRPDSPDTNGVPYIVVDEVRYSDKLPWPPGADGEGPSLQKRNPTDFGNEPLNWFASGITPGKPNAFNLPPLCTLVAPTNNAVYRAPALVQLRATAYDLDGVISRVEFYDGAVMIADVTNVPYVFTWTNASVGTHRITAKARDNSLAVGVSAAADIAVEPAAAGTGTGLQGDYYDNVDFTGYLLRRIDSQVFFDWGIGQPDPTIGADTFSVRWTGKVQPRFSGAYTFYTVSDDGIRLWVNNQLIIDNWTDHGPTENAGVIALQAGVLYDIKMEFYENGGGAVAQLLWSGPNVPKEIIPRSQLYPPSTANQPPMVALSSPGGGLMSVVGARIDLAADAFDPDGSVGRVEFFAGTALLGTVSAAPYALSWFPLNPGNYAVTAVAFDNAGLSSTSAPVNVSIFAGAMANYSLVPKGAIWRYRDTGEDLGSAWAMIAYNDNAWAAGAARLGYGVGGESTVINAGPNPSAKYITTYFRRTFVVDEPSAFESLNVAVLRNDGAVVYLNGSPVYRNNMPMGFVGAGTLAITNATGYDLTTNFYTGTIDPGYLVPGTNVLAVEVHLANGNSADFSFDLELTARRTFFAPTISKQPESQSVNAGNPVAFTVTAKGTAPLAYAWRFNDQPIGGNSDELDLGPVQPEQAGSYYVIVSNPGGSATSSSATLSVLVADADGDGMPDAWELANGLNPQINDAAFDRDGDGLTNIQEYYAGTDPQDPASCLRLSVIRSPDGSCSLQFGGVSGRSYAVVATSSLAGGSWMPLTNFPGLSGNQTLVVPIQPGSGTYYRVRTPAQ